jgi:hypothetical protein
MISATEAKKMSSPDLFDGEKTIEDIMQELDSQVKGLSELQRQACFYSFHEIPKGHRQTLIRSVMKKLKELGFMVLRPKEHEIFITWK